jgi:hypothetical protein
MITAVGWLEFTNGETSALAWPIATLVAIIVLRPEIRAVLKELANRLKGLTQVNAAGVELRFEKEVKELTKAAESLKEETATERAEAEATDTVPSTRATDTGPSTVVVKRTLPGYEELAKTSPGLAIRLALSDFESLLRQQFFQQYPTLAPDMSSNQIVDTYQRDGTFGPDIANAIKTMYGLADSAAQANDEKLLELNIGGQNVADGFFHGLNTVLDYLNETGFFKESSP